MAPQAIVLTPKRDEASPSGAYASLPEAPPRLPTPSSPGFKRVHLRSSDDDGKSSSDFPSNAVTTSRFTWYSFLPLFLLASFSKIANLYFLLVSVFQMIPSISPTGGVPTQLFPLVAVLLIDAIFAAVEDYRRHADDARANAAPTLIYSHEARGFQPAQWKDIHVGDIIQISNHETVPADVVLLSVVPATALGVCYVETKSLDGESNLKLREAPRVTRRVFESEAAIAVATNKGYVDMEQPNSDVHQFSGALFLEDPKSDGAGVDGVPLSIKNVLLRGCKLRNADSVYGLVVNTGTDCKVLRSSLEASAPTKESSLEAVTNRQVLVVVVLLVAVCLVGAITDNSSLADLEFASAFVEPDSAEKSLVETFAYYLTILCDLVPITLYVTITVVRAFQSFFMARDLDMYDAASDTPLTVRSMQLNEQLGQISHVFADKTGTLTSNLMELRRASIRGRRYDDLADAQGELAFFTHLALCHSVLIEHSTGEAAGEEPETVYSAASPDEQALVCGARDFGGVSFVRREPERVEIRLPSGDVEAYALLEVFEFSSDRKRMSVAVKKISADGSEEPVVLLTKGSDSVLFSRLSKDSLALKATTQAHLKAFAHDGLRTLVIATKQMGHEQWESFHARYQRARSDLRQVEAQSQGLENEIDALQDEMERDLELLGATAIEDELQDGVPETIETLRAAGVTVWMLTGDMLETAVNIGQSCRLLHDDMRTHVIRGAVNDHYDCEPDKDDIVRQLNDAYTSISELKRTAADIQDSGHNHALVIDGASLHLLLGEATVVLDDADADNDDDDSHHLLRVALLCRTVIACRVSPQQKAQLVQLVKRNVPNAHTLAIGDGANDVPMLLAAHVGVGIAGHEGMQAVNSSDYAFAQFRFLQPLLLAHGRWNYNRVAGLIGYTFYKNIVYSLSLFWFCMNTSSYSGAMLYSPLIQQFYNLIFTLLPIALFAIQDRDLLPKALVLKYPALYHRDNRRKAEFTQRSFWTWVALAVVDSVALFLVILASSIGVMRHAETVELSVLWSLGWTIMVSFVTARFCLLVNSWTVIEISGVVFSLASMLAVQILFDSLTWTGGEDFNTYAFPWILARPQLWLGVALAVVAILVKDGAYAVYSRRFRPQLIDLVHELMEDEDHSPKAEHSVS